jgi:hypothetical protein
VTNTSPKRRKPYPRSRKPRKTVFTPAMWKRWLLEEPRLRSSTDRTARHLRAGIDDFRRRLQGASHREVRP